MLAALELQILAVIVLVAVACYGGIIHERNEMKKAMMRHGATMHDCPECGRGTPKRGPRTVVRCLYCDTRLQIKDGDVNAIR